MDSADEEIFEITDFTCVTDWERFVGDLESRIREWRLGQDSPSSPRSSENKALPKQEITKDIASQDDARVPKFDKLIEHVNYGEKTAFTVTFVFPHDSISTSSSPRKDVGGRWKCESKKQQTTAKTTGNAIDDVNRDLSYLPSSVLGLFERTGHFVHESVDMGHHIVRYFGLRMFIVIEPASFASESSILCDESIIDSLMSAIAVATLNTGCDIPVLLQVADQWRWMYRGICQNNNVRAHFEMVHLRNPPPKCCHLAGILDMFKEHVACALASSPPVKVSVRITYELKESFETGLSSDVENFEGSPSLSSPLEVTFGVKDTNRLPFGAIQDTIDKIYLAVTWLNLNEDMLVENDVYSDLDLFAAPVWSLTVDFTQNGVMLMAESLMNFLKLADCRKNVDDVLGPVATGKPAAASALGRLTNSSWLGELKISQSAASVLQAAASPVSSKAPQAPLDDPTLGRLLQFLFPDAGLEQNDDDSEDATTKGKTNSPEIASNEQEVASGRNPPGKAMMCVNHRITESRNDTKKSPTSSAIGNYNLEMSLKKAKAAPSESLTSRLALVVCHLATSMPGIQAVCHIWREFVLELRYRWENGITLPGFDVSNPSLADCLFHQKLQMLNCCILHKLKRQERQEATTITTTPADDCSSASTPASSRTAGDEFYDCYEDTSEIDLDTTSKPEGRLRPLDETKAYLLEDQTQLLYIPNTQDPAPLTEDVIEQYRQTLTNMGTSEESALARAKMQTPSLLSDMEAFKAANPKSIMEDFIRWYSPRDWIEEKDEETGRITGKLSERMSVPGNLWREVWDSARPIPVARQRRLFDDTREAEKILHWLQEMPVSEFALHLLPSLFLSSIFQLHEEAGVVHKLVDENWKKLAFRFVQATMQGMYSGYEDARLQIVEIERQISQYRTLLGRLSDNIVVSNVGKENDRVDINLELEQFALQLLTEKDVVILGASRGFMGRLVASMFSKDERLRSFSDEKERAPRFPPFYSKEYILRWMVPRPQTKSRDCPQRCYVRVKNNEFRAASAFTEDVVFFVPDKR